MGTIRVLLALSVVLSHVDPDGPRGFLGGEAVRLFFIISGFYMAMILNEKYVGPASNWAFYKNRLLRLMPAYYVVWLVPLLIFVAGSLIRHSPFHFAALGVWVDNWSLLDGGHKCLLALLNVSVLGQEFGWLHGFNPTTHGWLADAGAAPGAVKGIFFLLNPPTWTLSLELEFYLLAPALLRRSWRAVGVALALAFLLHLALARWATGAQGFWGAYSLPGQFVYFMMGGFSYKLAAHLRFNPKHQAIQRASWWLYGLVLLSLVYAAFHPPDRTTTMTQVLLAASLPFIFHLTSRRRWDQSMGDLSYPVYLCHWNILLLIPPVLDRLHLGGALRYTVFHAAGVTLSLAAALVLLRWVDEPIEVYRRRIAARLTKAPSPERPIEANGDRIDPSPTS